VVDNTDVLDDVADAAADVEIAAEAALEAEAVLEADPITDGLQIGQQTTVADPVVPESGFDTPTVTDTGTPTSTGGGGGGGSPDIPTEIPGPSFDSDSDEDEFVPSGVEFEEDRLVRDLPDPFGDLATGADAGIGDIEDIDPTEGM
jgi:hypothetical protein